MSSKGQAKKDVKPKGAAKTFCCGWNSNFDNDDQFTKALRDKEQCFAA